MIEIKKKFKFKYKLIIFKFKIINPIIKLKLKYVDKLSNRNSFEI